MKKSDIYLIVISFSISLLFILWITHSSKPSSMVVIYVEKEEYGRYDLFSDQIIEIEDSNIVVIENGMVYMEEANCTGKDCVHQGTIQYSYQSIVCLPNQINIVIQSKEDTYDSITY